MEKYKSTANIDAIKQFQHLSETSRSLLARGLRYACYLKTTSLLKRGDRVSGAYVVESGQLRVYMLSPDGNEATLYLIKPGETCVLALNCIFNDLLYPAWVEAKSGTRISVIPGPVYKLLFESEPAIRNMTVQAFSTIVFRLMTELETLHSYKLEQRLANFILLHASTDGKLQMTQQEIASHLGNTREVIARALGQLASGGLIRTRRGLIVVNDPETLAKFVRRNEVRPEKSKHQQRTSSRRRNAART